MLPGLIGKSEMVVKEEDLVSRLGDVAVDVLSTPRLIQLLEMAAIEAIQEFIPPDQLSLGTQVKNQAPISDTSRQESDCPCPSEGSR